MVTTVGILITVEGFVGSGKTTLLRKLMESRMQWVSYFGILLEPTSQWQYLERFYLQQPLTPLLMQLDVLI